MEESFSRVFTQSQCKNNIHGLDSFKTRRNIGNDQEKIKTIASKFVTELLFFLLDKLGQQSHTEKRV